MARQSRFTRELADIEHRMQLLERQLEGLSGVVVRATARGSASVAQATDRVGDALMSALTEVVDRFRGGARVAGGEAARFSQEAAKLGGDAFRRVASEVERRPLVMLAVAAGVGLLVGLAGRRH